MGTNEKGKTTRFGIGEGIEPYAFGPISSFSIR